MKIKGFLLLLITALFFGQVSAASFKCKNNFVSIGDRKATVLLRCGKPFFAEIVSGDDDIKIEEWTYKDRAHKGFLRVLRFHGGKLVDISVAERVD